MGESYKIKEYDFGTNGEEKQKEENLFINDTYHLFIAPP